MSILKNGEQLGKAKIISNAVISSGASVPGRKLKSISYITLHNTGLVDVKANNFHRSLARENKLSNGRQASWHFSVDDIEIYQEVDTAYEAWHAGNGTGNKNSIGIEMCMWSDKEKQRLTYDNAARLVAKLMKMHNIPLSKVVQHNHWSGKNCPEYLRAGKHGYNWNWFISLVKKYSEEKPAVAEKPAFTPYVVKVTADVLNVRSGPGTNYGITTKVKKGEAYTIVEEKNGWGKLKSGAGWISLEYTVKK